ncbi:acyl-coenzyme A amino acid N-acyltransferase 2-like [Tenrec ecaudatus]|uniref:acyl-coenzyme A amino acid N-acyltransferase 2-like n=1 Tax=Tenrec ecaudatus TaxID=94439 RepID=UPI003F5A67FD
METLQKPAGQVKLTVTPVSDLADRPVHVRVTGLHPTQLVMFKASLKDERGNLFQSRAVYRANSAGEVDLQQDPSLGGDYMGVHPMGLFWSLKPEKAFLRLTKRDVMNRPFQVTLDLYDSASFQDDSRQPRASQITERWFSCPGMQRVPISEGRLRGALFLPPGEGPFPGVIDLFGGIGGLVEFRASLLATHGFAVLALAYFAYEDLPKYPREFDLEYFEEAANFLLAHSKVQKPGIGVLSASKGTEFGLAMASYLKQVVATVCINGPVTISNIPLRYKDLVMKPFGISAERVQVHPSGGLIFRHHETNLQEEQNQQRALPVEKAQGHILFIIGENDECVNSRRHAEYAVDRLKKHGKNNGRILLYPGAGHLLEPPYAPLCYASGHLSFPCPLIWGGDTILHAAAQEHSWGEIQKFFRQHLVLSRSKL